MSDRELKKIARRAIAKTLGLTAAAKDISILHARAGKIFFGTLLHLEFEIMKFDVHFTLELDEFGNDYLFIICNKRTEGGNGGIIRFVLKQEDLEE